MVKCRDCYYFEDRWDDLSYYMCHRYPLPPEDNIPETYEDYWCGEFKANGHDSCASIHEDEVMAEIGCTLNEHMQSKAYLAKKHELLTGEKP